MDLIEFKSYHDEVNRFLGKVTDRYKVASIAELVLIYGIRCEKLGYTHTEITLEELVNISNVQDKEEGIIEVATILYSLVPKVLLGLHFREAIRRCRTKDELYKLMLDAYENTTLVNEKRSDYFIKVDDGVSEKLLAITTIAMFMDKELFPFFTPIGRKLLCNNYMLFEGLPEADYLCNGMFAIYPLTTIKTLEKTLSRRKMETLAEINYRFKEEFLSDKEEKEYKLLSNKEADLLSEVHDLVTYCATAISCGAGSSENIRARVVKSTEEDILGYLESLQIRQDNLTNAIQEVSFKIVEEFDVDQVNLTEYMNKSAERVIEECREEIKGVLEIVSGIHGVTLKLSQFSATLDSSRQRVNSNKRALLRKYQGISEARRWMSIIMTDLLDTLKYYCEYINSETVEIYKEKKPIDKTIEKEIKKVDKDLKKKLKNIYCYKELNKIALDKGYSKVRQKGDHGIFRKSDGSVVVIPQGRDIGKGLSRRIQKDCNRE